jgi:Tfp pilus assembly protein PilO
LCDSLERRPREREKKVQVETELKKVYGTQHNAAAAAAPYQRAQKSQIGLQIEYLGQQLIREVV